MVPLRWNYTIHQKRMVDSPDCADIFARLCWYSFSNINSFLNLNSAATTGQTQGFYAWMILKEMLMG